MNHIKKAYYSNGAISEQDAKKIALAASFPALRGPQFDLSLGDMVNRALAKSKGAYPYLEAEAQKEIGAQVASGLIGKYSQRKNVGYNDLFIDQKPLAQRIEKDINELADLEIAKCGANANLLFLSAQYALPIIERIQPKIESQLRYAEGAARIMSREKLGLDDIAAIESANGKLLLRITEVREIMQEARGSLKEMHPESDFSFLAVQQYMARVLSGRSIENYDILTFMMLDHHIGSCASLSTDMQCIRMQMGNEDRMRAAIGAYSRGLARLENFNEILKSIKDNPENMGLVLYRDFL